MRSSWDCPFNCHIYLREDIHFYLWCLVLNGPVTILGKKLVLNLRLTLCVLKMFSLRGGVPWVFSAKDAFTTLATDWTVVDCVSWLQYSSQIVETGAICIEFSPNFLHSLLTPSFSLKFAPILPQCWAMRILEQWDDCNTPINNGEGGNHTSLSRFVTSIVFALGGRGRVTKRMKGNYFHL